MLLYSIEGHEIPKKIFCHACAPSKAVEHQESLEQIVKIVKSEEKRIKKPGGRWHCRPSSWSCPESPRSALSRWCSDPWQCNQSEAKATRCCLQCYWPGVVVGGVLLACDQLLRMEELPGGVWSENPAHSQLISCHFMSDRTIASIAKPKPLEYVWTISVEYARFSGHTCRCPPGPRQSQLVPDPQIPPWIVFFKKINHIFINYSLHLGTCFPAPVSEKKVEKESSAMSGSSCQGQCSVEKSKYFIMPYLRNSSVRVYSMLQTVQLP